MQTTFKMFLREQDVTFLQNNSDITEMVILKVEKINIPDEPESDICQVEVMCTDIGVIFIAGEHKGITETNRKYSDTIARMKRDFTAIQEEIIKIINP